MFTVELKCNCTGRIPRVRCYGNTNIFGIPESQLFDLLTVNITFRSAGASRTFHGVVAVEAETVTAIKITEAIVTDVACMNTPRQVLTTGTLTVIDVAQICTKRMNAVQV